VALEIIRSPRQSLFLACLHEAKQTVFLASPFIKTQTAELIAVNRNPGADFRYVTSFKLATFLRGASDLEALRILQRCNAKQKNLQNLHAKLFIFDNKAIVTSGNLTPGGLRKNWEYGVLLTDSLVDEVKRDYLRIFDDADHPTITEHIVKKAEDILRSVPRERRPRIAADYAHLFDIQPTDETPDEKYGGGIESIRKNLSAWKRDVFECMLDTKGYVFTLSGLTRGSQDSKCFIQPIVMSGTRLGNSCSI
jgi:hypothetical protein